MEPIVIISILLGASLLMAFGEFYLPGGILGVGAGLCSFIAVVMIFFNYGAVAGFLSGSVVLIAFMAALAWWMRIFHKTPIGKRMLMPGEVQDDKGYEKLRELIGESGKTVTDLMPSGKAHIGGRDRDVVTRHGLIEAGKPVRVTGLDGICLLVTPIDSP